MTGDGSTAATVVTTLPDAHRAAAVTLWGEAGLTRPWNDPDADLARALDGPASTVLAALDGDRLAGTAMVGHDGHRGWIYYLAVAPARRGEGLGRALVRAAEDWLGASVPKVQLMVRADNDAAAGFWRALGYLDADARVLGRRLPGPPS